MAKSSICDLIRDNITATPLQLLGDSPSLQRHTQVIVFRDECDDDQDACACVRVWLGA